VHPPTTRGPRICRKRDLCPAESAHGRVGKVRDGKHFRLDILCQRGLLVDFSVSVELLPGALTAQ
jgi:hypothetical protein